MSFTPNLADFNILVGLGQSANHTQIIPGVTTNLVLGTNSNISANSQEDIWELGFQETPALVASSVYLSSSSALDTGDIIVTYLDATYAQKQVVATMTGQTQALVATDFFRSQQVVSILPSSKDLQGDVYLAESDTLTAGVPDTDSKIHGLIKYEGAPRNRSINFSRDGRLTVPKDCVFLPKRLIISSGRNSDVVVTSEIRIHPLAPWFTLFEFKEYQNSVAIDLDGVLPLEPQTEFRFVATAQDNNANVSVSLLSYELDLTKVQF